MNIRELQDFFDQSQDIVALLDRGLHYEAANLEYCRYWGVSRDQVLGAHFKTVVGDMFDHKVEEFLKRCLDGEDVVFERWLDFPGVGRRHMDVRYTTHRGADGEIAGVFLISRDTTDRANLKVEVQAERDKLNQILSALNVGLVIYDRNLVVKWHNDQLGKIFSDGDLVGSPCHRVFKAREKPCEDCPALETLRTGELCSVETEIPGQDRRYVLTTVPLLDAEGNANQILGHVADVTEQRRSMKALKQREAELNSIFRATRVGIGVVKDRVFTQANDHFFTMLGYSPDEVIGQNSRLVYASQADYEKAGQEAYGAMRGDKTSALETRWKTKDGEVLAMLVTVTLMNPEEPGDGATFVAMDITDRKRAEAVVRDSELRFRSIFENVDMIAVQGYDCDRRVVYWNPASEHLYGYSCEEAMGQSLEDLIIPEPLHEMVKAGHEAWFNGGPAIPAGELVLVHKDGSPVPVYSSHVMQETLLGEKVMYCVDVDLTDIKRIHNRLVRAKDEAEEANRAKSEFLANMSHEIRTPLNGIKGMLSLLSMGELGENEREYVQAGIDSATRLNRLLSDILDLSRVEAGKMAVELAAFNLPYLVRQVGDLFRLSFSEKGLDFECSIASEVPEVVIGDSARLQQILANLVGNGLKYTDAGKVRVDVSVLPSVAQGKHRLFFSISDTGIGIGDDVLSRLFEPFTQGSQGYTRQYQGAGLGLSICKRLVRLMGGHMAVESEAGVGSVFHLVIPFEAEVGMTAPVTMKKTVGTSMAVQLRVLLAEDDKVNSIVGQRMLEKAGCSVTVVRTGTQVLEALREGDYAVVFMDVQMPDMDGVEATRFIREGEAGEANMDIPIYALTAYTMAGDREKLLGAGMDGYVPKPVEIEDVLEVLRHAVEKRH